MKVVLAICALDFVATPHYARLLDIALTQTYDKKRSREITIIGSLIQQATIIPDARRTLVETSLRVPSATHIWFVDSDIVPPLDVLGRLASHRREIVAATYPRRYPPHELLGNQPIPIEPSEKGLRPMANLGLGCALIDLSIFARLPRPWFNYVLGPEPGNVRDISEDAWFCARARAAGLKVWLDPSLVLGHVGQKTFLPGES